MKHRKKQLVIIVIVVVAVLIVCGLFVRYWKPLRWAHTVNVKDVSRIEVAVQPCPNGDVNTMYKEYEVDAFSGVIETLNQYQGRVKFFPKTLMGGYVAQYVITMTDGKTYIIANNGRELYIGKVAYKGDREMLEQWLEANVEEVDSPVPDGFWKID